jgi:hypothetical protein
MPDGDVETFYEDGQWHNKVEGTAQVISSDDTLDEAVDLGRDMARVLNVAHVVKDEDGTVVGRRAHEVDSDLGRS